MHRKSYKQNAFERFPNVIHKNYLEKVSFDWEKLFNNSKPLGVELGCSKAGFLIAMALRRPDFNWLGLELRSPRIWFGAKAATQLQIPNIRFMQANISELENFFLPNSIQEIWLTFPEPHPKKSRAKNRFTHRRFLEIYRKLLRPEGAVFLKTDNPKLYDFSLQELSDFPCAEILENTENLYNSELKNPYNSLLTGYERSFLKKGEKTYYIKFTFTKC